MPGLGAERLGWPVVWTWAAGLVSEADGGPVGRPAASQAAQVAATPAGVKETRLARGTNFDAEAVGRMRESSTRGALGWETGGRVATSSDMGVASRPVSL